MNKRWSNIITFILIMVLLGYIVLDRITKKETGQVTPSIPETEAEEDKWFIANIFDPGKGQLNAVTISADGTIILGGETFIICYNQNFEIQWDYPTEMTVTALTVTGNNIYAAVQGTIFVLNFKGEKIEELGPFESNSMITSLAANEKYVAFADAANTAAYILDKEGVLKSLIGKSGEPFIIPSSYFDLALSTDNILLIANTGKHRIEKRKIDGTLLGYFGEPGVASGSFCGCCNPSHFTPIPGGFVTAEKGINRIKILDTDGRFIEFVSSVNDFIPPLPLDIASAEGKIIYGVNPADSKLYVFKRKS